MLVQRTLADYARFLFTKYPIITITGPRQSGKTTFARQCFPDKPHANLEALDTRAFARDDPRGFLAQFPDGAILDEVQRVPQLLSYLQPLVDDAGRNGLFVLTGSQQLERMEQINQSLAGRTALLKLLPFSIEEMRDTYPTSPVDALLYSGFYPRIHHHGIPPTPALGDYFETYIERDLRQLIQIKNLNSFERFVRLCAGRAGQLLNLASLGDDAGVSHTTAREWLSLLEASYIVFLLPPWFRNIGKRLVKASKLYFYDVGLASYLCGIEQVEQLATHPLRGNFFENMVVMEALKYRYHRGNRSNLTFYRDVKGHEVDLIITAADGLLPVEIKGGQTINTDFFSSLRRFKEIEPQMPFGQMVVYGGNETQRRSDVTVLPVQTLAAELYRVFEAREAT